MISRILFRALKDILKLTGKERERIMLAKVYQLENKASDMLKLYEKNLEKKSLNTAKSYFTDLNQFTESVFGKDCYYMTVEDWNSVTEKKFSDYFENLHNKAQSGEIKMKNSTLNRKMGSIKEVLKYMKKREIVHESIQWIDLVESYNDDSEGYEAIPLKVAEQYALWFKHNEKFKSYEKYLITVLAYNTGLRLNELLNLSRKNFKVEEDSVVIKGRGKGNKKYIKRIGLPLYELIKDCNPNSEKLFTLSEKNVTDMIKRVREAFGHEDKGYTFHSLKKTHVTWIKAYTGDIQQAQKAGNHAHITTTMKYLAEEEYGITDVYSLGTSVRKDLFSKIPHEMLVEAISNLWTDLQLLVNLEIQKIQNNQKTID